MALGITGIPHDSSALINDTSIVPVRRNYSGAVIFLKGDNDANFPRGGGVTDGDLSIFTDAEFDFG